MGNGCFMNGVSMLDLDNTKTGFTGHHMVKPKVSSEFLDWRDLERSLSQGA